jgi:hypothetical protein
MSHAQLSPFAHELDRFGAYCAIDCAACHWRNEKLASEVMADQFNRFSAIIQRYAHCELFQIGLRELGLV